MTSKWPKRIMLIVLGVIVVLGAGFGINQYMHKQKLASLVDRPQDVTKWTADPRPLQSEAAVKKQFKQINEEENNHKYVSMEGLKLGVIPGLRGAWSINNKTKKADFGTDWVPQGLTQSATKYFISVYDGNHQLNSLIFQIDKRTRKYEKSLILSSMAHVGGITYEDNHHQLIYSNDLKGYAGFGVIQQSTIDNYNPVVDKAAIKSKRIPFAVGSRTSAITTYKNLLVVAKYGRTKNARSIVLIPTQKNGDPEEVTIADKNKVNNEFLKQNKNKKITIKNLAAWFVKKGVIKAYYPGWNNIQGVSTLDNGFVALSQSAGQEPSTIFFKFQNYSDKRPLDADFKTPNAGAKEARVPHSIEELSIDRRMNNLSMIFESGAREYRETMNFNGYPSYVDRFATLPANFKQMKAYDENK